MSEKRAKAWHPDQMEWLEIFDEHVGMNIYDKRMVDALEDGIMINFSKYPAGYYKPAHTHPCGHGIYVIKGKLRTEEGIYGPGSFVWHPEGCVCRHGATEEEDCEFLFITNKPFDIFYEE